ncbi:MAG: FAD-dependent oxidoreductase [Burkholderiaceae bacterium]
MAPFWFAQALERDREVSAALVGPIDADVCIVGGGFTGLWTALQLKAQQPALDVVLIDAQRCGAGASGRNGGCVLTWATKFFTLARWYGEAEAVRLVRASEAAVLAIEAFVAEHAIDCQFRRDGTLYTATSTAQQGSLTAVIGALEERGVNSYQSWPLAQVCSRSGSIRHLEGVFSPMAASVQPGLLVRGLRRVALEQGVRLFESTPLLRLDADAALPMVHTPAGSVQARKVVLATNAWMPRMFAEFARSVVLVSSDMAITEPCPELLAATGLADGLTVLDSRIFVHYYRSTPDGRLMLGKGGNTFAFANRMQHSFDAPSAYAAQLRYALDEFFPSLREVPIAATWNGASDRSATGLPFFGHWRNHRDIVYGFGYSGNGVGPSHMGGRILASMVREAEDDWTRSPLTQGPLAAFPPEPVRWIGAMTVRDAVRRKERAEDLGRRPAWLDVQLARLAAAAGKSDKSVTRVRH